MLHYLLCVLVMVVIIWNGWPVSGLGWAVIVLVIGSYLHAVRRHRDDEYR